MWTKMNLDQQIAALAAGHAAWPRDYFVGEGSAVTRQEQNDEQSDKWSRTAFRLGGMLQRGHNSPMTHASPSAVTGSASAANFSDEVFAAREERLRALMLRAQAGA